MSQSKRVHEEFAVASVTPRVRVTVGKVAGVESRVKQSFKDQCDINRIMGRYLKTRTVDWATKYGGSFGEATALSFHEAMNVVSQAEQMFADLPSDVRKRFANEPGEFVKFVADPANVPELRKLGLALPEPAAPAKPAPLEVKVVDGPKPAVGGATQSPT